MNALDERLYHMVFTLDYRYTRRSATIDIHSWKRLGEKCGANLVILRRL